MKQTWQELAIANWEHFMQLVVFIRAGELDRARDYIKFCEHNEAVHKLHTQISTPAIVIPEPISMEVANGNSGQSSTKDTSSAD